MSRPNKQQCQEAALKTRRTYYWLSFYIDTRNNKVWAGNPFPDKATALSVAESTTCSINKLLATIRVALPRQTVVDKK